MKFSLLFTNADSEMADDAVTSQEPLQDESLPETSHGVDMVSRGDIEKVGQTLWIAALSARSDFLGPATKCSER